MADHVGTRSGWNDHRILGALEHLKRLTGHLAGAAPIAGVEGRLTATGLREGELDLDLAGAQHGDHRLADCGEKAVDETGREELNLHGRFSRL